jgi:Na+:H+ antiporter, NhaA family
MAPATNKKSSNPPYGDPPGSWWPARRLARRALAPVEKVLAIEAASGILLLAAAAISLIWANSPWRESYDALWQLPVEVRLGSFSFERDLHFWVNDGLMTIFFFVVGLEIRREIHDGELSQLRRAALPLAAAVGGMLVPAGIFAALNMGHESVRGWGIPMATDIAFAVGVLTLLGRRVPPGLRILLLALAVIDDVGAILIIAIFYSSGFAPIGFLVLGLGLALIVAMQLFGVRTPWAYVAPGVLVWAGVYAAGIHPTLAGVIIGLMTPVRAWFGREGFIQHADTSVAALRKQEDTDGRALLAHLERLDQVRREAVAPVERIEHALHGWVAFGVMPLFAMANAGVSLGNVSFSGDSLLVFSGVAGGLVLGKPIGILMFSWLATQVGLATLPRGVTWSQVGVVGMVAGIGFTMSIFIAALAFPTGVSLETSKVGILVGSGIAAVLAYGFGWAILRSDASTDAANTTVHAEPSNNS